MNDVWTIPVWTRARQISAQLRWPPAEDDDVPPDVFFQALRRGGRLGEAAMFLGQALPRFEAVLWASAAAAVRPGDGDQAAMTAVGRWLRDPSDEHRRSAGAAASAIRGCSAARLCALAAFVAGGSLVEQDKPPVVAPKDATGRFAAAAVLAAASSNGMPRTALERALDHGSSLAAGRRG